MNTKEYFSFKNVGRGTLNYLAWFTFLILIIVFSITVKGFFSYENIMNIMYHSVFIGILAIAQTFVMISGNLDLSVESIAAFSCIFSVWLTASSVGSSGLILNTWLTLLLIIVIGATIGAFNAFFIVKLKINSFLVTLATYIGVRSLVIFITQGAGMYNLPEDFVYVNKIKIFGIPFLVIIMILLIIMFELFLRNSTFGRHVYIVGGNMQAAYSFGINVDLVIFKIFVLSGVISALTGWLMAARLNGATTSVGKGLIFDVMAAVVIGGVSLSGGFGSLVNVLAGVLVLSTVHNVLNLAAISPLLTGAIQGAIILVAISLDSFKRIFK